MDLQDDVMVITSAAKIILRWDTEKIPILSRSPEEQMIFYGDRAGIDRYLQAIDDIQRLMKPGKVAYYQSGGTDLVEIAMARLQFEFMNILSRHNTTFSTGQSSTTYLSSLCSSVSFDLEDEDYMISGTLFDKEVDGLRSIARRMNSSEHLAECVNIYSHSRSLGVKASFKRIGTYMMEANDIKNLEWEELQMKIQLWIRAAKWVRFLFSCEMMFYEQVFDGHRSASRDACFVEETFKDVEIWLFEFAEAVSTTGRSPHKLFKILDLHRALLDFLEDTNVVFRSKSSARFQVAGNRMLPPLVKMVRGIVSDFGNSVIDEQSNGPVPAKGTIHALTRYVADYISHIADYKETLTNLIVSFKPPASSKHAKHEEFLKAEGQTPLSLHMSWIIINLRSNMEKKSKNYEDESLGHLFMMNNVNHIVQIREQRSPELQEMIGSDHLNKLREIVSQRANTYMRSTWDEVVDCLRDEGVYHGICSYRWVSKNAVRKSFKNFNAKFDEVCRSQSKWSVPNKQLRSQLHELILEILIPAYESFLEQFKNHIEGGEHAEEYIKYSKEDLEHAISNFFV